MPLPAPPTVARPTAPRLLAGVARALATLWMLWACGGGGGERQVTAPPPPKLAELWLEVGENTPARTAVDSMEHGDVRSVRAVGRLSNGRTAGIDSASWTVSDTTVLKAPATARAAAITLGSVGVGSASVAATAGGLRAEIRYTVVRPRVSGVVVIAVSTLYRPPSPAESVVVQGSRQFRAGVASKGGPLTDRAVTWQTTDTAIATVTVDGTVSGRALGTTTLTATVEGVAGSQEIVVRPPLAARLAFTYAPDSLYMRRRDSVRAVFYDSAGARMAVQPNLRVSGAATLLAGGVVSASAVGTTEIVASGDGLTVRRPLRVLTTPQGPPTTYPATVAATAGTSVLLAARASDVDGFAFTAAPVPTYASADPAVASVTDAGVVTARAPGATVIRVTTGATRTDVPMTILPASGFALTLRAARATPLSPALDAALRTAAAAWERAVIGDLSDLRLTLPPGACNVPTIPDELAIDDVLIFASADSLDGPGGVLAQAGPCIIRGDGSAAAGRVQVDSADVERLVTRGQLAGVLQHELGHVLGIGTLWSRPSLGLVTRSGLDYRYLGTRGRRVSDWWSRSAADGILLGEANGPGDGHWDEAVFGTELMTPVLNAGINPLSLLTIEALADLGYTTSAAGAEGYALYAGAPAAASSRAPAAAVGTAGLPFDRLLVPRWRAVGNGRVQALPAGAVR